jgi:hypothetical protein
MGADALKKLAKDAHHRARYVNLVSLSCLYLVRFRFRFRFQNSNALCSVKYSDVT